MVENAGIEDLRIDMVNPHRRIDQPLDRRQLLRRMSKAPWRAMRMS
jgi:hypothetical protein